MLGGGLFAVPRVWANEPARVRSEIVALLGVVEHCGCSFMRNGSWHSSADARKMLEHKLNEALRSPAGVTSTEQFIEKLASRSSMSGKPYMVQCTEAKAVESGPWLMIKLAEMRSSSATRPPPAPPR